MLNKEQNEFIEKHFRGMYTKLFAYASHTLNDPHLSEEAVQDTFRIACVKIDAFYISMNPEGWLVNTLRNVIRNMRKNQITLNKYIVQVLDIEHIEDSTFKIEQDFEILFGDISKSDDFKLLLRILLDKYTMLEASKEFGITVEACKKRVQRIKQKLIDEYNRNK